MIHKSKSLIASTVLMLLASASGMAQDSTLITNARVVDGTGAPA